MADKLSRFPGTNFMTRPAPEGFGVRFRVADDKSIYANIVFDESKQGDVGILHGGAIAAVLDEAMGVAAYEHGHAGYTVSMTYNYKKHIPLQEPITVKARVDTVEGRKIFASCEAYLPDGAVAVDGSGVFIASKKLQKHLDANAHSSED